MIAFLTERYDFAVSKIQPRMASFDTAKMRGTLDTGEEFIIVRDGRSLQGHRLSHWEALMPVSNKLMRLAQARMRKAA